jgi:hypothetical protein
MPSARWNHRWRRLVRKLLVGFALVCYFATAVGFPLPALSQKDSSQAFPCQYHACGCRNAEACWQHCCCFSPEERLAWAQSNHIEPPPDAEPAIIQGWHAVRLRDQAEGTATPAPDWARCSLHKSTNTPSRQTSKACCADQPKPAGGSHAAPPQRAKDSPPASPIRLRWASGLAALRCHGLSTFWVSSGAVLPPPSLVSWEPFWPLVTSLAHRDAAPLSLRFRPPDPPPRWSGA